MDDVHPTHEMSLQQLWNCWPTTNSTAGLSDRPTSDLTAGLSDRVQIESDWQQMGHILDFLTSVLSTIFLGDPKLEV